MTNFSLHATILATLAALLGSQPAVAAFEEATAPDETLACLSIEAPADDMEALVKAIDAGQGAWRSEARRIGLRHASAMLVVPGQPAAENAPLPFEICAGIFLAPKMETVFAYHERPAVPGFAAYCPEGDAEECMAELQPADAEVPPAEGKEPPADAKPPTRFDVPRVAIWLEPEPPGEAAAILRAVFGLTPLVVDARFPEMEGTAPEVIEVNPGIEAIPAEPGPPVEDVLLPPPDAQPNGAVLFVPAAFLRARQE